MRLTSTASWIETWGVMIGSIGVWEILFIFVLALLVFGPKKLPEIGRMVGKGLAEFRKASNDFKRTLNAELALEEEKETTARRASVAAVPRPVVPTPTSAAAEIVTVPDEPHEPVAAAVPASPAGEAPAVSEPMEPR